MKAARILPPLLAAATLVLIGANAVPSVSRKHRLREERTRLVRELERARRSEAELQARIHALRTDPFYLERMLVETWHGVPQGAVPFRAATPDEAE